MGIFNKYYLYHKAKVFLERNSFFGKQKLNHIFTFFKPKMRDGITVYTKLRFNLKIFPVYDKGIERTIYERGIYEEGTLWCFKEIIKKGQVIFDVGGNIGLTTVYASKLTGRKGKVYSFEPMPETFQLLKENIEINRLKNVEPINLALSNEARKAIMFENLNINRGAASLYSSNNRSNGINVKLSTLDAFCEKLSIDHIDFIKIDIEGEELNMLKGAMSFFLKADKKPILCIEFSRDVTSANSPDDIYSLLRFELNYDLFKLREGKEIISSLIPINSYEDLPFHDNLFCFQSYHYDRVSYQLFD